jgi:probable HAF family extracellular repeat protein
LPGVIVDGQLSLNFLAFLWTKERGMQDLGTLPGDAISEALGINDQGQVVGVSFTAGFASARAFIWQDGVMKDLNTLVAKNPSNISLIVAADINARGEITGEAFDTSAKTNPAFLAIPGLPNDNGQDASPAQTGAGSNAAAPVILPPDVRDRLLHRLGLRSPVQ